MGSQIRFLLPIVPIFALIAEGFGQVPLTSVAGQPFSGDEVIILNPKPNVRNVIPMKTIRIYRDSAGRTREDVSIPRDPTATQVVNILDPIAGIHYYLDTEKKIARRLVYPQPWKPAVPESVLESFSPNKFRKFETTSESLGTQLIGGLTTEGKRITTISLDSPPGCDVNKAVNESWYSPELRMILLEKTSNCMWDGTTRLEHINRAEPDPGLFQPPSDYTVIDQAWSH